MIKFISAAYLIREFNNLTGKMVIDGGVRKSKCFLRIKEAYASGGRLEICGCEGPCESRTRVLQYTGLTINIIYRLHEAGYTMTLQQVVGTKIFETFTAKYCTTEMVNNVLCYRFIKNNLPFQASAGQSSYGIFSRDNIPVVMAKRFGKMI